MDEQKNGTPQPPRRRRAAAQQKAFEEFESAQHAEAFQQPREDRAQSFDYQEPRVEPLWADEYVEQDASSRKKPHKKKKKKNGSGCLIGVLVLLALVLLAAVLALTVGRDALSAYIPLTGIFATATPEPTPIPTPTSTP